MPTARDLSDLCGSLLVVGFPGTTLDDDTARAIRERRRAGVIRFRRNIESVESTHELVGTIRAASDGEIFIGVDQEGGRVTRVPAPAVALPPMRILGDIGDLALTRRAGTVVGAELSAIGFNVNFAPVLDVDSNPRNPIIGDRAFSRDPSKVADHGIAFAEGLQSAGVLACGKHFPGHGDTHTDSHLELPTIRRDRAGLDAVELLPFRRAAKLARALMTAHVVYEGLDPGVPATHSRRILTDLLRRDLGFDGLVFSDDLEMRAVADRHTVEDSAVTSIRAGCDVLLVCKDPTLADRAHLALVREATRDRNFRARCEDASHRSRAARAEFPFRPAPSRAALRHALERSGGSSLLVDIQESSRERQQ